MRSIETYDKNLLLKFLKEMVAIHELEVAAGVQYGLRKIGGFCHLYLGQEAVAVGTISQLNLEKGHDAVYTSYRDHAHAYLCGVSAKSIMAELFGKKTGQVGGRGGSMHFFNIEKEFYGGNGIVGEQIPIACGTAMARRNLNQDGVVLVYFGDGAIHQGSFHESMNMAQIWDLPVLFICENNQYGMGTPFKRVSSQSEFYKMGAAYNVESTSCRGDDIIEVYETTKNAIAHIKKNKKPYFMEILTYRVRGHSMSDPDLTYRTKEEVELHKTKLNPILELKDAMIKKAYITEEDYTKMVKDSQAEMKEAIQFANESEEPDLSSLEDFVYA